MKHCEFCKANFINEDAYQIHLGVGAPAFHDCLDETAMQAKGMTQNKAGTWSIDEALITHHQGWASLKTDWAQGHLPSGKTLHYSDEHDLACEETEEGPLSNVEWEQVRNTEDPSYDCN